MTTSAATSTPLPELTLYARAGCGLCDETRDLLVTMLADRAARALPTARLVEVDIASDPVMERDYRTTIPVVELGDRRVELATSAARLHRLLADVLDA